MQKKDPSFGSGTTDLDGAARFFGVSTKTFRTRLMPHIPALNISGPNATRQRRRFSVAALQEALRTLVRPAA